MGLKGEEALAIAQKYTDESIEGIVGALAGKPCQIQSITPITGGNRVTYLWEDNSGDSHTSTMDVMNGVDGKDGVDGDVPAETLLKDTVGWTGKNLNQTKYPDSVLDRKGIDWTYNSETGIVTANGTSTDKSTFGADGKYSFVAPCTSQVILSGCDNENSNVHIYPYDTTTNSRPYKDSTKTSLQNSNVYGGREVSFYMEEGHNYIITCRINAANITVDNFKFYPMLRKAEISDPTFEPYHKDVVDTLRDAEVITGKNLFSGRKDTFTNDGIVFTPQGDGTYLLTGTVSGTGGRTNTIGNFTCKAGVSYVLSGCPTGGGTTGGDYWLGAYPLDLVSSNYGQDAGEGVQITTFTTDTEIRLMIRLYTGFVCPSNFIWKPMICTLEEWNKSHDYEPYYIPAKDAMFRRSEQRVLGAKNLFLNTAVTTTTEQGVTYTVNSDKTVTVASGQTMTTYTNLLLGSVVLPEGDYILNGCPSGGSANTYRLRLVNGSTLLGIDSGNGYSFHADGNTNYTVTIGLSVNGVSYTVPTDLLFKPMIRFASDPDDTYTPYAKTNKELTEDVKRVPTAPTTDGTYTLKVTVADGTPTYSWVSE